MAVIMSVLYINFCPAPVFSDTLKKYGDNTSFSFPQCFQHVMAEFCLSFLALENILQHSVSQKQHLASHERSCFRYTLKPFARFHAQYTGLRVQVILRKSFASFMLFCSNSSRAQAHFCIFYEASLVSLHFNELVEVFQRRRSYNTLEP